MRIYLDEKVTVRNALDCLTPDDASLAHALAEVESLARGAEDGQLRHHLQRAIDGLIAARHRQRRLVTGALPEIQTGHGYHEAGGFTPADQVTDETGLGLAPECSCGIKPSSLSYQPPEAHNPTCPYRRWAWPTPPKPPLAAHPGAGSSAPLVSLGQGEYRTEIDGDPRTGRLDVRA